MKYTFTLNYQLAPADNDHADLAERLGEAGCDDALLGVGQPGRIALEFTREAGDADAALLSALVDVRRAIPSAHLIEAAPDLVGLTDVAELVGMSRQNMRKLMVNGSSPFPPPVHEGNTVLWHLADVLGWLGKRGIYELAPELMDVSKTAKQVNIAKEALQLTPAMQRDIQDLIAG